MLATANRLRRDKDIKRLVRKGRSFYTDHFRIRVDSNGLTDSRFGFVVSTQVSKKAVVRNRIKRQLREIVRLELHSLRTGYDVLLAVKSSALGRDYELLQEELKELFSKARLYNDR